MKSMMCPACGHEFSAEDRICPSCNTPLPETATPWFQITFSVVVFTITGLVLLAALGWWLFHH
jgi:hypothetical protein